VVSEKWIRESTKPDAAFLEPSAANGNLGYAYQWWVPAGTEGAVLALCESGEACGDCANQSDENADWAESARNSGTRLLPFKLEIVVTLALHVPDFTEFTEVLRAFSCSGGPSDARRDFRTANASSVACKVSLTSFSVSAAQMKLLCQGCM
jgi:hypothetical protein